MRTQRCARCNKRLKGPYQYWSFTTGAPRAICKKCKEIHQPVKQRKQK
nr:MAG TPA: NADH-PPase NADH pyrophosphatase zinc ribbon domain [Caudoviricetes sp.]